MRIVDIISSYVGLLDLSMGCVDNHVYFLWIGIMILIFCPV